MPSGALISLALTALQQTPPAAPAPQKDTFTELMGTLIKLPGAEVALVLLVIGSVLSWAIILYKWWVLRTASSQSETFLDAFWQAKRLDAIYQQSDALQRSPIAQVFRAGYIELARLKKQSGDEATLAGSGSENIERSLRRASNSELTTLESLIPFLATVGSTAPFVGLFGTVWGIMKSFNDIGRMGSANLATVAPGISEALIATAVGLLAAIPAVIAYNFFGARIKVLDSEMESFQSDFINIVRRHFFK